MGKKLHWYGVLGALLFGSAPCNAGGYNGFYLGAEAGYASSNVQESISIDMPAIGTTATYKADQNVSGPLYGVFAGFGRVIAKNFYVGAEANYTRENQSGSTSAGSTGFIAFDFERKTEITQEYGASPKFGYLVTSNTLLSISPGYQFATMKWQDSGLSTSSGEYDLHGPRLGIGIETMVTKHFSMRADISRTWFSGKADTSDPSTSDTIKVYENAVKIGTACHF